MFKRNVKASMTVEAVFVVPIVLFVIIALIYLAFYLHDRVRLEEIVERGLGQGNFLTVQRSGTDGMEADYAECNKEGNWGYWKISYTAEKEQLKKYLEQELNSGFFFLSKESVSCEINGFSVEIRIKMKGKISINPVKNLWQEMPEVLLERSIPIHNPEEVLRIYEGLKVIADNTESAVFTKNYIEKLQNAIGKGAY